MASDKKMCYNLAGQNFNLLKTLYKSTEVGAFLVSFLWAETIVITYELHVGKRGFYHSEAEITPLMLSIIFLVTVIRCL